MVFSYSNPNGLRHWPSSSGLPFSMPFGFSQWEVPAGDQKGWGEWKEYVFSWFLPYRVFMERMYPLTKCHTPVRMFPLNNSLNSVIREMLPPIPTSGVRVVLLLVLNLALFPMISLHYAHTFGNSPLVKFPQITQFMVVSCSCQDPDHLWRSLNLFSLNEWLLDFDLSPYSDSESCLKQDFFHLDIIDIWGQKLFVIRGCSMHCRLLSWIPGLNLLYDSSTLLLVVITKSVSRPSQMSCGGSITHSWEQGSKRMKLHLCNLWASSNQQGSNWEVLLGPWVSVAKGPHGLLIELDSQIIFFPNRRFPTSDGIMMTWLWKKTIFFSSFFT